MPNWIVALAIALCVFTAGSGGDVLQHRRLHFQVEGGGTPGPAFELADCAGAGDTDITAQDPAWYDDLSNWLLTQGTSYSNSINEVYSTGTCEATGSNQTGFTNLLLQNFYLTTGATIYHSSGASQEGAGADSGWYYSIRLPDGTMYAYCYYHTDNAIKCVSYNDAGTGTQDYYVNDTAWPAGDSYFYIEPTRYKMVTPDGHDTGWINYRKTASLANSYIQIQWGPYGNKLTWDGMTVTPY